MRDPWLLYAATFARSLTTGALAILLPIYLAYKEIGPIEIGAIIGAGLAGNAGFAALAMLRGDRIGRRRLLAAIGLLGGAGTAALAFAAHPAALIAAAFLGSVNGMGRDRGAAVVLETALVPTLAEEAIRRTRLFSLYNAWGDLGHALGGLLAMLPRALKHVGFVEPLTFQISIGACAAVIASTAVLSLALSGTVEAATVAPAFTLTPRSRGIVLKLSALLGLDALGGGFLTVSWLSLYFHDHFKQSVEVVGALFFAARVVNALSHIAAGWLAIRFGLLNTMVFTHIPSSVLLVLAVWAPTFPLAAALFILREGLSQMDVPTRQAYLMAVVEPEERTFVAASTHLVRLGAWALAPLVAGPLTPLAPVSPFVLGASLKVLYDVLLFRSFRKIGPSEEARRG